MWLPVGMCNSDLVLPSAKTQDVANVTCKSSDAAGTQPSPAAPAISLAYLTSTYPTLSMSFFLREVIELRAMGNRIDVASVNLPIVLRSN